MHGHHLNYDLPAQFSVPERVDDFSLNLFLAWLDECSVCLEYPDEYFVNMLESRVIQLITMMLLYLFWIIMHPLHFMEKYIKNCKELL